MTSLVDCDWSPLADLAFSISPPSAHTHAFPHPAAPFSSVRVGQDGGDQAVIVSCFSCFILGFCFSNRRLHFSLDFQQCDSGTTLGLTDWAKRLLNSSSVSVNGNSQKCVSIVSLLYTTLCVPCPVSCVSASSSASAVCVSVARLNASRVKNTIETHFYFLIVVVVMRMSMMSQKQARCEWRPRDRPLVFIGRHFALVLCVSLSN